MDKKIISQNLQVMRLRKGMTTNELAERAGVSAGTLARHEHGYDMTVTQLWRYVKALGCSVDDILYGPMPTLDVWSEDKEARFDAELEKLARRFGRIIEFTTREQIFEEMSKEGDGQPKWMSRG